MPLSLAEHKATLGIFLLGSARVSKAMSGRVSTGPESPRVFGSRTAFLGQDLGVGCGDC